jgi:hypothetical protein
MSGGRGQNDLILLVASAKAGDEYTAETALVEVPLFFHLSFTL